MQQRMTILKNVQAALIVGDIVPWENQGRHFVYPRSSANLPSLNIRTMGDGPLKGMIPPKEFEDVRELHFRIECRAQDITPLNVADALDDMALAVEDAVMNDPGMEIYTWETHLAKSHFDFYGDRESPWGLGTLDFRSIYPTQAPQPEFVELLAFFVEVHAQDYGVFNSIWTHPAKLQYRISPEWGQPFAYSNISPIRTSYPGKLFGNPAPLGTDWPLQVRLDLQYKLDCVPNVPGYSEDWTDTGFWFVWKGVDIGLQPHRV